ncbi:MAG: hypothetical protein JWP56_3005 [Aeromicrobium sp.]|nr:hypothetical protein [Aeromicrobium sp.]
MKRIVTAILSTITILVLLFGYHTSTSGPLATSSSTSVVSSSQQPVSGTSGDTGSGGSTSGSSGADASSSGSSAFTGTTAQTRWGPVQVKITVDGGKVSNVSVIQYPNGNGKDQEINSRALPVLIDETKQAQSADIDMVSGATVTSQGYLQSLQSALDKAKL